MRRNEMSEPVKFPLNMTCVCGFKENIEWRLCCWKPIQMDIHVACKQCGRKHQIQITFPENPGEKLKVEEIKLNYIG